MQPLLWLPDKMTDVIAHRTPFETRKPEFGGALGRSVRADII